MKPGCPSENAEKVIKREKRIAMIKNNRADGNGPLIAQQIAKRFLDLQG